MSRVKVLLCITVYNGRAFVPRAIESAVRVSQKNAQVDVLVLDDASPEPGWSADLEAICKKVGANYYLTPRNLGIPRNVSLGMLTALKLGYDHALICNSDTIFPTNLVDGLVTCAQDPKTGAITAWSNNVSIYSLPNQNPDELIANQEMIDGISEQLWTEFGNTQLDIPTGIGFCILVPTRIIREIGVNDPCFGRGYCEETDHCLRIIKAGYRMTLAPGVFVYHQGRGSNLSAGLVTGGHTTVAKNEAIIDLRYPDFRTIVDRFMNADSLPNLSKRATRALCVNATKNLGYHLNIAAMPVMQNNSELPVINVITCKQELRVDYKGFAHVVPLSANAWGRQILDSFGDICVSARLLDPAVSEVTVRNQLPTVPLESRISYTNTI
jgi:GT2 family glycosyltransferase